MSLFNSSAKPCTGLDFEGKSLEHRWRENKPGQYVCTHCGASEERNVQIELRQLQAASLTAEVQLGEMDRKGTWRDTDRCRMCQDTTMHEYTVTAISTEAVPLFGKNKLKRCKHVDVRCMECGHLIVEYQLD